MGQGLGSSFYAPPEGTESKASSECVYVSDGSCQAPQVGQPDPNVHTRNVLGNKFRPAKLTHLHITAVEWGGWPMSV